MNVAPSLLTAEQAAAYLGMGLTKFKASYIRRGFPRVIDGAWVRYDPKDLDEWRALRKVGKFVGEGGAEKRSRTSASRTKDVPTLSPRENVILLQLERQRRANTRG